MTDHYVLSEADLFPLDGGERSEQERLSRTHLLFPVVLFDG